PAAEDDPAAAGDEPRPGQQPPPEQELVLVHRVLPARVALGEEEHLEVDPRRRRERVEERDAVRRRNLRKERDLHLRASRTRVGSARPSRRFANRWCASRRGSLSAAASAARRAAAKWPRPQS